MNNGSVIRAIYELHRRGPWPTSQEIAEWLKLPHADVKRALGELMRARLFRTAQRDKRKVWMPWGEV